MKIQSVRGATTADNTTESITERSRELIRTVLTENKIKNEDIVNIIVSTTSDLTAFYPARAIRESGVDAPLFSALEPKIDGALDKCIRVMVTAYTESRKHVYLHGAKKLRPDLLPINIAIDGPSGAGKSTVAKIIAKTLNITYLDTGALYRSLGLKALNSGLEIKSGKAMSKMLESTEVTLKYVNGEQRVFLDGKDVSTDIRRHEVSKAASDISALKEVREKLLSIQRDTAAKNDVVLDGRDIGTVVLPDAPYKFFLTASAEERARRRTAELQAKGDTRSFESVLADILERDKNDSTRAVAPLKKADDAEEINSDGLTAEQVADIIIKRVKAKS